MEDDFYPTFCERPGGLAARESPTDDVYDTTSSVSGVSDSTFT